MIVIQDLQIGLKGGFGVNVEGLQLVVKEKIRPLDRTWTQRPSVSLDNERSRMCRQQDSDGNWCKGQPKGQRPKILE